jgi:hypothetical protein
MRSSQARSSSRWNDFQLRNARAYVLLHQVLGLLARPDEVHRDSIDLIRQSKRLLLEAHASRASVAI